MTQARTLPRTLHRDAQEFLAAQTDTTWRPSGLYRPTRRDRFWALMDRLGAFIDSDLGARVFTALIAFSFGVALMLSVAAVQMIRGG